MLEEEGKMYQLPIGEEQAQNLYVVLLRQLQAMAERYDLGIPVTEALTAWAFTVTASPTQNFCQAHKTLMSGLRALSSTMSEYELIDIGWVALMHIHPNVRMAAVIRQARRPTKIVVYLK